MLRLNKWLKELSSSILADDNDVPIDAQVMVANLPSELHDVGHQLVSLLQVSKPYLFKLDDVFELNINGESTGKLLREGNSKMDYFICFHDDKQVLFSLDFDLDCVGKLFLDVDNVKKYGYFFQNGRVTFSIKECDNQWQIKIENNMHLWAIPNNLGELKYGVNKDTELLFVEESSVFIDYCDDKQSFDLFKFAEVYLLPRMISDIANCIYGDEQFELDCEISFIDKMESITGEFYIPDDDYEEDCDDHRLLNKYGIHLFLLPDIYGSEEQRHQVMTDWLIALKFIENDMPDNQHKQ